VRARGPCDCRSPLLSGLEDRPRLPWPPFRRETLCGADVRRAPLWVPKSPEHQADAPSLSFALTSFPLILMQLAWRPEMVITVAPAFMCARRDCSRRCHGRKVLVASAGFRNRRGVRMGLLKGKLLQRVAVRMESWLLRRFDTVSTISSRMMERLLMKGVSAGRICYFPNWVDVSRVGSWRSRRATAPSSESRGRHRRAFLGNLGANRA